MIKNKKIIIPFIFTLFVFTACRQAYTFESPTPNVPPVSIIPTKETVLSTPTNEPTDTPQSTVNLATKEETLPKPDESTTPKTELVNGFALVLSSSFIFSCDLPESWEYNIYPVYSKSFYEYEGEMDASIGAYFYYSETNPNAFVSLASASPAQRKPFEYIGGETEHFSFADGGIGMRKLLDGEYYYKEYIYCPDSKYYVTLNTSKQDYLEHEEELRAFLDSIAFGRYEISPKASKDPDKTYQLHIWNEFLQAELTVRPGTLMHAIWEWEDTDLIFRHLSLCPENSNTKLLLEPAHTPAAIVEDSRTWERCKLASGLVAYRTEFEEDGQKGTEYQLKRSDCRVKIYGEETTQIDEILQSINIR